MIELFYLITRMDPTITTTNPGQNGLECNGNERVLRIAQISSPAV